MKAFVKIIIMVSVMALLVSAQSRKPSASIEEIAGHKAKKEHPELFMPKDEYETSTDYQSRVDEGEALINQIKGELEQEREEIKKAAISASVKKLEKQKIEQIGSYDADNGVFEVTVLGKAGTISVPKESAKLFKQNYKKANVTAMSQLDEDLETVIISEIEIIDPNDSTVYALQETPEIGPELVLVKGGTFQMGGNEAPIDEKPIHNIAIGDFYIGKYEVTQEEWESVMGSNPSNYIGPNKPVDNVNWDDIQEYIVKLSALTGRQYRLPTEAEWEYASRGGNKSKGYRFSGSNDVNEVAWNSDNSNSETHEVGQMKPNELGLFDMSGNVWEWCSDWYDAGYYKKSPAKNPQGPSSGQTRVLRSGSWGNEALYCRSAARGANYQSSNSSYSGVRLASSFKKTPKSK